MKNIINEELNYMKYLFDYQRGKVISEQKTNKVLEKDGCEKGFYRDCATKNCVNIPKGSVIVYSQEEFDKKLDLYDYAKKYNSAFDSFIKRLKNFIKKYKPNDFDKWENIDLVNYKDIFSSWLDLNKKLLSPEEVNQIDFYVEERYYGPSTRTKPIRLENLSDPGKGFTPNQLKKKGHTFTGKYYYIEACHVVYGEGCVWIIAPQLKERYPILGCLETPLIEPDPIRTEPVKIETIDQITKVEDFPKEFILFGNYRCDGTNGLGRYGNESTYKQQCMSLPQNLKTDQRLASWEIKFPPNVAGNPYTVPVTRWNFIWNSDGKISEIKMQNFDKIPEEEQIVYNNLLNQKTSSENLKAFMKIAYGDDTYYTNNVENFM